VLVAATVVAYANGVGGAFTYDDKAVIRDDPRIRTPAGLSEILRTPYFGGPRGSGSAYRPALLISYAAQWWIHGPDPRGFHAGNIAFHAGAVLLLAWLLLRIGVSPPASFAAALLFAVAPIHVEAVTSLVGRGETQAALFVFAYLHFGLSALDRRRRWPVSLVAALLCYALALLTKESAAVAPALAGLLLVFIAEGTLLRRMSTALRRGWLLFAGSVVVLALYLLVRAWVLGGLLRAPGSGIFEVENALAPLGWTARAENASLILWRYVGRSVFPAHLSADESAWSIRALSPRAPLPVFATLLLASTTLLAWRRLRESGRLALGVLLFVLAFLPAGNLLFPIGTIFAERIAYLPSAGIFLILGVLLVGRPSAVFADVSRSRRLAVAGVALLFGARTVARNSIWWSDESLFANSLATAPGSAKAEYNLAYIWSVDRNFADARAHYQRAVEIYPGYWDAWAGKGRVEKELGLLPEAERSYKKSIEVNAGYENGYFGLGLVREAMGRPREALDSYREGFAHVPRSLPLAYRWALVSGKLALPEAASDWKRALGLGSGSAEVRTEYARWLRQRGKDRESVLQAREALRRDPGYLPALRLLAERGERDGLILSEALALEKAYRLTRSEKDFAELERIAESDPPYRARLRSLRLPAPSATAAPTP
jgi:protein O-mannosyl-transferase